MHVKITLLTFFKVAGSVISNRKNSVGVKFAFCSANNEFLFSCDGKELKEEATVREQKCCSSGSITSNWELLEVTRYAQLHCCCCCIPNLKSKMKKTWSFLLSLTVPLHFRLQFLNKKKKTFSTWRLLPAHHEAFNNNNALTLTPVWNTDLILVQCHCEQWRLMCDASFTTDFKTLRHSRLLRIKKTTKKNTERHDWQVGGNFFKENTKDCCLKGCNYKNGN